jgi:DNA-binding response OmpR family regulator
MSPTDLVWLAKGRSVRVTLWARSPILRVRLVKGSLAMRMLLVEDDVRLADALAIALRRQGHQVQCVTTAADALAAPGADLILLDLGLPDSDGVQVCRELRERGDNVAIIAVTARGGERDKVVGLRSGADDYMVKPFALAELYARIEAVLRRVRPIPEDVVAMGPLRVDVSRHYVERDGRPISLTRKEFDLLKALIRRPGQVVERDRLILEVWGTSWQGAGRTLDVHMASLRGKLGTPPIVATVRGIGYQLTTPSEPDRPVVPTLGDTATHADTATRAAATTVRAEEH